MTELFDIPEALAPWLAWKRANGVKAWRSEGAEPQWCAWMPNNDYRGCFVDPGACGYGETEEEAIEDLAVLYDDHWNKPKGAGA